jgi:hypothetical protein
MPLQSSGQISLNDLHVEAGGTSGTEASMNDSDIRGLLNAAANSQMPFSSFYGAGSATTILSGNSQYTPSGQYTLEAFHLAALTPHTHKLAAASDGFAASSFVTLNGRNTYPARLAYFPGTSRYQFYLADFQGGVSNTATGFPANSGWSSITLTGGGNSITLTRVSGTYATTILNFYINGTSSSAANYGGAFWYWDGTSNIFPSSNNTTSFTLEIS